MSVSVDSKVGIRSMGGPTNNVAVPLCKHGKKRLQNIREDTTGILWKK